MLDGSDSGELNALAIFGQGEHFISSGNDKVIKLWDYDEGIAYYQGIGHSGNVTKVSERNAPLKEGFACLSRFCNRRSPSRRTKNSS